MSENQTHTLDEQSAHLIGQLAALKRKLAEARKESKEQARLLGMSGEREASLLAELAKAKEQLEIYRNAQAENKRVIDKAMDDPPSPQWIAIDLIVRQLAKAKDEIARLNQSLKSASTLYDAAKEQRDRLTERIESLRSLCATDHESKAAFIDRVNAILYPQNVPTLPPA